MMQKNTMKKNREKEQFVTAAVCLIGMILIIIFVSIFGG